MTNEDWDEIQTLAMGIIYCDRPCGKRRVRKGRCDCEVSRRWAETLAELPPDERRWLRENMRMTRE